MKALNLATAISASLLAGTTAVAAPQSSDPAANFNCHTPNNGGNFSVLTGNLRKDSIEGVLHRSVARTETGDRALMQFDISGVPTQPAWPFHLSFATKDSISIPLSDGGELRWNAPTFQFIRGLRRGYMHETGTREDGTPYEIRYVCTFR